VSNASSLKTTKLAVIFEHIRLKLAYLDEVIAFVNARRMKRLRVARMIKLQQYLEKIVKRIMGGEENIVVIVGKGKFKARGPLKRLWQLLASRVPYFFFQNEDCSSMLSCCCHQVLENVKECTNEAAGSRVSWTVRHCGNNACFRTYLDRNISAAINILYLFLCEVYGKGIPALFEKGINRPQGTKRSAWPWPWDEPRPFFPRAMQLLLAAPVVVQASVVVPIPIPIPIPVEGGEAMDV
jgi:hypothetical protein